MAYYLIFATIPVCVSRLLSYNWTTTHAMHIRPSAYRPIHKNNYRPNSTWLVTSRLDKTLHVRRVERVETSVSSRAVRQAPQSTQPKCMGSTRRTCRVVSRRDVTSQVEFGLIRVALISVLRYGHRGACTYIHEARCLVSCDRGCDKEYWLRVATDSVFAEF